MILNDYQKKLIAEGFYSRLMDEDNLNKRIQMILEFMDSFMPKDSLTSPTQREGPKFEWPKNNFPITSLNMDDVSSARG